MSWIRTAVKGVHLLVLLLVCCLGLYSFHVSGQHSGPSSGNAGALSVVSSDTEGDDLLVVESEGVFTVENMEPFVATNEWQKIKPGQAIPRGLHVRMNIQTGENEARLLQDQDKPKEANVHTTVGNEANSFSHDELKKAVKQLKSEKFKSVDMETLQKEKDFRSYDELKEDMEKINAGVKTDSEIITELVEQFKSASPLSDDIIHILSQLEYSLHQIDNAVIFCDLGAMPQLLKCMNSTREAVRSEAALTLGSAVQSNPKVQISAIENGAIHEVLRLLTMDVSPNVRKRSIYALSAMIRQFPFAQKRFLELGGLQVLGSLIENRSSQNLQVRAVTLLADLIEEKERNLESLRHVGNTQGEREKQYQEVKIGEAVRDSGLCSHLPGLLEASSDYDSQEKVLVAMETLAPVCGSNLQAAAPRLAVLRDQYTELAKEEQQEGEDDGFFQSLATLAGAVLTKLASSREEL